MKKIVLTILFGLLVAPLLAALKDWRIAPYYNFSLDQGVSLPSVGDWDYTINLTNDVGLIVKPTAEDSVVGFYEIKYVGPGLRTQEGEKFSDRYMDHLVVARYQRTILTDWQLKFQTNYLTEYRLTGANELWGQGLYDFNQLGIKLAVTKPLGEVKLTGGLQLSTIRFPNYTDLLSEIQTSTSTTVESSAGKQDQNNYQLSLGASYGETYAELDYIFQNYLKQKVVTDRVQPDGSYYSSDLQRDGILAFQLAREQKIPGLEWLKIIPELNWRLRFSNQNYQHFENIGDTVPVRYFSNYFSYSEIIFNLPVYLATSKSWEISLIPQWDIKTYADRPARAADGSFLDAKQSNNIFLITLGLNHHYSQTATTTIFYTYQSSSSNMKYEKYLPYNYTGHYIGFKYSLHF